MNSLTSGAVDGQPRAASAEPYLQSLERTLARCPGAAGPETEDLAARLRESSDPLAGLHRFATARANRLLDEARDTEDRRLVDEAMLFWGAILGAVALSERESGAGS